MSCRWPHRSSLGICTWKMRPTKDSTSDSEEDPLVGHHDGQGPAQPRLGPVGVDRGPGGVVARRLRERGRRGTPPGSACRGPSVGVSVGTSSPLRRHRPVAGRRPWPGATGPVLEGPGRVSSLGLQAAGDAGQPGVDGLVGRRQQLAHPWSVSTWATRRRSSSAWRRSTRPRLTSPSTTAVTLGGRTASRSARAEEMAEPSSAAPGPGTAAGRGRVDQAQLHLLGDPGGRTAGVPGGRLLGGQRLSGSIYLDYRMIRHTRDGGRAGDYSSSSSSRQRWALATRRSRKSSIREILVATCSARVSFRCRASSSSALCRARAGLVPSPLLAR